MAKYKKVHLCLDTTCLNWLDRKNGLNRSEKVRNWIYNKIEKERQSVHPKSKSVIGRPRKELHHLNENMLKENTTLQQQPIEKPRLT